MTRGPIVISSTRTPTPRRSSIATDPSLGSLRERLAALDDAVASLPVGNTPPALVVLQRLFRLGDFERDVLLLCLAPELDAGIELLYAYVQDDATRRHATPALALALIADGADPRARARAAFAPHAALRGFRLIQFGASNAGTLFSQPLRIDERIVHYVGGVGNEPDATLARALKPLSESPLARAQQELVTRLAGLAGNGDVSAFNLIGPPGSARHAIAVGLGRRLGLTIVEVDPVAIPPGDHERRDWISGIEREAVLLNLGFYLHTDSIDAQDRVRVSAVRDFVESLRAFLVIGSRERVESDRTLTLVNLPKLDAAARRALWGTVTGASVSGDVLDALAQQFEIGPHAMVEIAAMARDRARLDAQGEHTADLSQLWRACRERAAQPLQDLGRRIVTSAQWDDLILPAESAAQLREIASQVAHRTRVYDEWGFGARLSRGLGISALFAGPSGTGKTMAAEVLARHLDLDLFRIDLSGVVSKYIGETEKNLRRVFDAAEHSGAILFFDEADALFGKRSEVKDSHDRYANIEINYLLQRMEDYRGLAILATNMKSHLDAAFVRRLRFIVDIPFPDADIRHRIWQRVFPQTTPTEGLDFTALSRLEVAGGSIKNIALNASFAAAATGVPVRMEHVLHAARREYQKLEKMLPTGQLSLSNTRSSL